MTFRGQLDNIKNWEIQTVNTANSCIYPGPRWLTINTIVYFEDYLMIKLNAQYIHTQHTFTCILNITKPMLRDTDCRKRYILFDTNKLLTFETLNSEPNAKDGPNKNFIKGNWRKITMRQTLTKSVIYFGL